MQQLQKEEAAAMTLPLPEDDGDWYEDDDGTDDSEKVKVRCGPRPFVACGRPSLRSMTWP